MVVVRLALLLALLPNGVACSTTECTKPSDCNQDAGESCLFAPASGCSAQGHCEKQNSCKEGVGPPTVYCSCDGVTLALQCVPSNGITDRTTAGLCAVDGGADE